MCLRQLPRSIPPALEQFQRLLLVTQDLARRSAFRLSAMVEGFQFSPTKYSGSAPTHTTPMSLTASMICFVLYPLARLKRNWTLKTLSAYTAVISSTSDASL